MKICWRPVRPELEAAFELQRVRNRKEIEALAELVSSANRRIDDLKDYITWGVAILGVSVAVAGVVISVLQLL